MRNTVIIQNFQTALRYNFYILQNFLTTKPASFTYFEMLFSAVTINSSVSVVFKKFCSFCNRSTGNPCSPLLVANMDYQWWFFQVFFTSMFSVLLLVCVVGSCLSHGPNGQDWPGICQVSVTAIPSWVVYVSERPVACVRVCIERREPPGSCMGVSLCVQDVRTKRKERWLVFSAVLSKTSLKFYLVSFDCV